MSCACSAGESCGIPPVKTDKIDEVQKMRKRRQYALFGSVLVLFTLRWFHIFDSAFGIDTALIAIFIGAAPMFSRALDDLLKKKLTTDVLIMIAIIAALAVPAAHLAQAEWLGTDLNRLVSSKFFPAGSVIIIMMGIETLEIFTLLKMKSAVDELMALAPKKARIKRGLIEEEVDIEIIKPGDILLVKSGEGIPVDGVITKGSGSINESTITGEGIPLEKTIGELVMSGTICELGTFEMRATKVGEDTTLSRVVRLVQDAQIKKPKVEKYADRIARIFIPTVLGFAIIVFLITHDPIKTASVLLVACPCALSMATPAATVAGIGNGARKGIMIKGGTVLEAASDVNCVVFDKTGTLTLGKPSVTDVSTFDDIGVEDLLFFAASAEKLSEHAVSTSILNEAKRRNIAIVEPTSFKVFSGKGVFAEVKGSKVLVGNIMLMDDNKIKVSKEVETEISKRGKEGKTPLIIAVEGKVAGVIAMADVLKENSREGVENLRKLGIKKIVLLSGDHRDVTEAMGRQLDIEDVRAEMLPEDKVRIVEELKIKYKVAMVGDGINDAPALSAANVSIAMGSGTDVSIGAADIILKTNDIRKVSDTLRLSKQTLRTIKGNMMFSMIYNVIGFGLAATGLFIPAYAVIFQEAGCFSVMLNSALLIRFK